MPIRPTTPFERRSLTLAHVATQMAAANRPPHKSQDDASADGDARRRRPDRPAQPPLRQAPRPQGRGGEIKLAFGPGLGPLVARAEEFQRLAEQLEAEARAIRLAKEQITLCR